MAVHAVIVGSMLLLSLLQAPGSQAHAADALDDLAGPSLVFCLDKTVRDAELV